MLPQGVTDGAVRAAHSDGFVTTTMGNYAFGGRFALPIAAYNGGAIGRFVESLGLELDSERGHIWGWVTHAYDPPRPWLAGAVGCATVAVTPDAGDVYYTEPRSSLANSELEHTSPVFSTWYAFNVTPGEYDVTATADGGEQANTSFFVRAGEFTTVHTVYSEADAAQNPTPADCAVR